MGKESEFGCGLAYNLGLFIGYEALIKEFRDAYERMYPDGPKALTDRAYQLWFYGAADHMYDLETENVPKGMKARVKLFKDRVMSLRNTVFGGKGATKKDYLWAIDEAKTLLRMIDRHLGIKSIKGQWQ